MFPVSITWTPRHPPRLTTQSVENPALVRARAMAMATTTPVSIMVESACDSPADVFAGGKDRLVDDRPYAASGGWPR
jgi:hypothetical protein